MDDARIGCRVELGSMTLALKTQKILGAAAIPTTVIKTSASGKGAGGGREKGCRYGLSFSCFQTANVRMILENENIRVREAEWKEGN